jgi:hypothetical protein
VVVGSVFPVRGLQHAVDVLADGVGGGGGGSGVSANEYSCAHHVTWRPNKRMGGCGFCVPVRGLQHAVDVLADEAPAARAVPPLHLLLKRPHLGLFS